MPLPNTIINVIENYLNLNKMSYYLSDLSKMFSFRLKLN